MNAPDPRFVLANERTFLAYVRTSLAVFAGAVAVIGYVPDTHVALAVGCGLLAVGFVTLLGGYARWRSVSAALEAGRPVGASALPSVITVVLIVTVLAALAATLTLR